MSTHYIVQTAAAKAKRAKGLRFEPVREGASVRYHCLKLTCGHAILKRGERLWHWAVYLDGRGPGASVSGATGSFTQARRDCRNAVQRSLAA